jgi:hypothetical protein
MFRGVLYFHDSRFPSVLVEHIGNTPDSESQATGRGHVSGVTEITPELNSSPEMEYSRPVFWTSLMRPAIRQVRSLVSGQN